MRSSSPRRPSRMCAGLMAVPPLLCTIWMLHQADTSIGEELPDAQFLIRARRLWESSVESALGTVLWERYTLTKAALESPTPLQGSCTLRASLSSFAVDGPRWREERRSVAPAGWQRADPTPYYADYQLAAFDGEVYVSYVGRPAYLGEVAASVPTESSLPAYWGREGEVSQSWEQGGLKALGQESVNGIPCIVAHSEAAEGQAGEIVANTWWIAPDRGYLPVQRVERGRMRGKYAETNVWTIPAIGRSNGVWFPRRMRIVSFWQLPRGDPVLTHVTLIDYVDIELNGPIESSLFDPRSELPTIATLDNHTSATREQPAGTSIEDVRRETQQIPAGDQALAHPPWTVFADGTDGAHPQKAGSGPPQLSVIMGARGVWERAVGNAHGTAVVRRWRPSQPEHGTALGRWESDIVSWRWGGPLWAEETLHAWPERPWGPDSALPEYETRAWNGKEFRLFVGPPEDRGEVHASPMAPGVLRGQWGLGDPEPWAERMAGCRAVVTGIEEVLGRPCWRVSGTDRDGASVNWWVSAAHDWFPLRFSHRSDRNGRASRSTVETVCEVQRIGEVWCPRRIRVESTTTASGADQPVLMLVAYLGVGLDSTTGGSLVNMSFPVGTAVTDTIAGRHHVIGASIADFRSRVRSVQSLAEVAAREGWGGLPAPPSSRWRP